MPPHRSLARIVHARVAGIMLVSALANLAGAAAQAQDYHGKLTTGVYESDGRATLDVNARYSLSTWTGWLGWYGPQSDVRQTRAGLEYDLRRHLLVLTPAIQVASHSFFGGSVYSEIGGREYVIAGVSRTDLKPYANLTFDPNESWQLGAGAHVGKSDSLAAYSIWDNRLHTAQRNSHAVVRHYFAGHGRVMLDLAYKSGRGDAGVFLHGTAVATEIDWRRWFIKAAREQHVNFGAASMWRFGGGLRF